MEMRRERNANHNEKIKKQVSNDESIEVNESDIDWCSFQKRESSNKSLPNSDDMIEICSVNELEDKLSYEDPDHLMAIQL